MQKIILTHADENYEIITEEFVGDQYSVGTFGYNDVMMAVLESVDAEHERPVLMVASNDVQSVRFIYED